MKKYFDILKDCSLFDGIHPDDLERMLTCMGARVDSFDKKYTIFAEGTPAKYVGIVLSGEAQTVRGDLYGNRTILSQASAPELVGEAFDRAVEAILGLPEAQYIDFLAVQAARASSSGYEEVMFSEKDRKLAAAACKAANSILKAAGREGRLTVADDAADIPGGLIIRQGNIEVNCAVDTLVMLQKSRLAGQVASILF